MTRLYAAAASLGLLLVVSGPVQDPAAVRWDAPLAFSHATSAAPLPFARPASATSAPASTHAPDIAPRDLTEVNDFALSTPGLYVLLTDRNLDDLSEVGPTAIEVVGTLGDAGFTAEYVFNRDACHVWKLSGPDTVQLLGP